MKRYGILAAVIAALLIAAGAYTLTVTSRAQTISGSEVGDVVVGNAVAIRIQYSAGGLTPGERATVVARRLSEIPNLQPADIAVGRTNGEYAVFARGKLLVTADPPSVSGKSAYALATQWRDQLRSAISRQSSAVSGSTGASAGRGPDYYVRTSQKLVPILSVGSGLRVGAALVAGSEAQVKKVTAVAQIEGDFKGNARVRALVPVSSEHVVSNIQRVPGTAVIAVADIKL